MAPSPTTEDLFRGLADSTRRRILDLLAERGTMTVGELAAEFPDLVSSGISKHSMGLRAAGLVAATRRGRQRLYRIDADVLAGALAPWPARYEPYWSAALERLRDLVESQEPPYLPAGTRHARRGETAARQGTVRWTWTRSIARDAQQTFDLDELVHPPPGRVRALSSG